MVSQETSFVEFLETTAELLLENREVKNKPKIIFFGREEATELSDLAVQLAGDEDITICVVELDFFSEDEAVELIKAYMEMEEPSLDIKNVNYADLIKLYFTRIESGLRIDRGQLWRDPIGKAFAGYAPVLSAIGRLLAKVGQPHVALSALQHDGEQPAWAVIENVMAYILTREQQKVASPLGEKFGSSLNGHILQKAYDASEQLVYLAQLIQGQPIIATGNADFGVPSQNQAYIEIVKTFISEHPFVREGVAVNNVFESFILANAVHTGFLSENTSHNRLEYLSRYPFLWRCFWNRQEIDGSALPLHGSYVGFILRSYCNDPLTNRKNEIHIQEGPSVASIKGIEQNLDGDARVIFEFRADSPLRLFGSIHNCNIDLDSIDVQIVGDSRKDSSRSFQFTGDNTINCKMASVETDSIGIKGTLLIRTAEAVAPDPKLRLLVEDDRLATDGAISNVPPWNNYAVARDARAKTDIPNSAAQAFSLIRTIETKLRPLQFIYTNINYEIETDDRQLKWLCRCEGYKHFLNVAVGSGIATAPIIHSSGAPTRRIMFQVALDKLRCAGDYLLVASAGGDQAATGITRGEITREMLDFWKRYGLDGK